MFIPHSRPRFNTDFVSAAKDVIQSGQLAAGKNSQDLAATISRELGLNHTLAVDSGTSALMLAIRALTIGKRHARVGISAYACASLWFAVKNAGATPVVMDCNDSLTLNAEQAQQVAATLDVLVLVHPFGMVEPLAAETFDCPVIEDIAQSVGATLHNKPVGSFGHVCIGSLYATKPWGGAYGGFISSNDAKLLSTCAQMINPDHTPLATDYVGHHQLSNIHATLASVRISHAKQEQQQRQTWANAYDAVFTSLEATPLKSDTNSVGNDFRYIVRSKHKAHAIIQQFHDLDIGASQPVQQVLHHANAATACPQAYEAWQHCISIPLLADMTNHEFELIQQGIQTCFKS